MELAALRRWWPLAAVVVLLALASLAAAHSAPQLERIEPAAGAGADPGEVLPQTPPPVVPTAVADPTDAARSLPGWVGVAALVLLGVLVVLGVVLVVRALIRDHRRTAPRRGRRGRGAAPETPAADEVVAALDAGLQDLSDADRDPRRAVIACWVRLEQAAAAAGTPRRPDDTPTDLVTRLLAEQHVSAEVLAGFAAVYREARYATHIVGEQTRSDAREALQRLRTDLAGVPS